MFSSKKEKKLTIITLSCIISLSALLHVYKISTPSSPVFDESHFATYSADYVTGGSFFDIHPPLGKLIYASVLTLFPKESLADATFITMNRSSDGRKIDYIKNDRQFGTFPYVALRLTSALFGLFLILTFYFFLQSIGLSNVSALLGAFFISLDNALLLDTRLILLNGMYLFFGILALTFYFKKKPSVFWAGVFLGLSLSVKLTGIVFLLPMLIHSYFREKHSRKIWLVLATVGPTILLAVSSSNFFLLSPSARFSLWQKIGLHLPQTHSALSAFLLSLSMDFSFSFVGYLVGATYVYFQSSFYFWPIMYKPIVMTKQIVLEGNPVIWFSSTAAVLASAVLFFKKLPVKDKNILNILLGGYVSSMLIFLLIRRATFLYHYYPALLFAIALLAWLISYKLGLKNLEDLRRSQIISLCAIVLLCLTGFYLMAPLTYGVDDFHLPTLKPLVNLVQSLANQQ